jgi:hypothetical protein
MSCASFDEFVNRGGWTPRKGVVSPLEARKKKEVAEGAGGKEEGVCAIEGSGKR